MLYIPFIIHGLLSPPQSIGSNHISFPNKNARGCRHYFPNERMTFCSLSIAAQITAISSNSPITGVLS